MFNTSSLWFEVAIVSIVFALGNMFFGHFEERSPKWRRLVKYIVTLVIVLGLSVCVNRIVSITVLSLTLIPFIWIHGYYLPYKKGINGWTGEPKGKYYEFRGWNKDIFNEH